MKNTGTTVLAHYNCFLFSVIFFFASGFDSCSWNKCFWNQWI